MINYGVIGKEIGTILSQQNALRLQYFKQLYGNELQQNLNELKAAKQDFFALASKDYTNSYLKKVGWVEVDENTRFFYSKEKALSDFMNDRTEASSSRLWKAIEDSERTITKIRSAIYGGQNKTKYHIGISIKDESGAQQLKSYELDPEQMMTLQNNPNVFQAEISLNKKQNDFSLRLTTKNNLKSTVLEEAILAVGGYNYHTASLDELIDVKERASKALQNLGNVGEVAKEINRMTNELTSLAEERKSLGRRIKDGASARRHAIDEQTKNLTEQIKALNQYQVQELGMGRAFEAYERKLYNLEWLPTQYNGLMYNDNTSWIMQQDVNFIEQTNQAALMMIQNKFFAEGSRFSTISLSSLFTAQKAFFDYFSESSKIKWEFTEKDKKRLDTDVRNFAQQAVNTFMEDSAKEFKGIDMGD